MTFTHQLWDRARPVNGAAPDAVLAGFPGIPDDSPVVLVLDGDAVVQLQPTDPSQPGWSWWTDPAAAIAWADAVVDGLNNPPPPPVTSPVPEPDVPVTRAEFQAQQEALDWLTNYVITGEA